MTTMTKELLTKMTPKEAVDKLMEGNTRFQNNALVSRDFTKQREETAVVNFRSPRFLVVLTRVHLQKLFLIKELGTYLTLDSLEMWLMKMH